MAAHPPDIGIEDEDVDADPVTSMLGDGIYSYDSFARVSYNVSVCVGFDEERRPVELDGGVVLLGIRSS